MEFSEIFNNLTFNGLAWQVIATLCFIFADVVTGFICALIKNNLDSKKMREGLLRKMLLIIIIGLSFIVQYAFFNVNFISKAVCLYIILMEIVSILENLKLAGIDIGNISKFLKIKENDK